ncbi:SH3 domain-containing protein [Lachnospiraceae bacterium XBB1006]|nr:SH3 domain-containing protein [Lachnospiraceae bacterium XBB1006]
MDKKQKEILINFMNKYRKQCYIGVAVVVLLIVLCFVLGRSGSGGKEDTNAIKKNESPEVEKLVGNYYKAAAKGDVEKLQAYATPISDNEKAYIKLFAKYVEAYDIKNIYTKRAVDDNSCLVSVEMGIKFKGVKTEAPGLDFFYVTGLDSKELYIVNLYSQFNAKTKEYKTEKQVADCILAYENLEEVVALKEKIQSKYDKAIDKDEKLDVMVNSTIEDAVSEWMGTVALSQNQTPPESVLYRVDDKKDKEKEDVKSEDDKKTDEKKDDTKSETGETKETKEDEKKTEVKKVTVTEYVKTKEEVNLRKGASTKTDSIAMLKGGVKLRVVSMNVWGEWTLVKTKRGKKGYIRNDFLKTVDNKYTAAGKDGYPKKKQKCKLTEKSNLLNKMKKSARVISSLRKGTKVRVITCYVNGYSKVKTNGRVGYVLTEKLKID